MDIVVAPEAVSADIDGATVVLTPDMRYVRLDTTGGTIWKLVSEGHNAKEVVDGMCTRFEVDRSTAERDVRDFLNGLAGLGLVTLSD